MKFFLFQVFRPHRDRALRAVLRGTVAAEKKGSTGTVVAVVETFETCNTNPTRNRPPP
jgi:hypothetical protein